MATTTLTFGGDEIVNLPKNFGAGAAGESNLVVGSTDYIFVSGATAASVSANNAADTSVSIVLSLLNATDGSANNATLFAAGTSIVGSLASITFDGNVAAANTFLDNAYVIDGTPSDTFNITISAQDLISGAAAKTQTEQYAMACFTAGTRLATPDGERAVEALAAGDLVTTLEGGRRIAWIGTRFYEAAMIRAEPWLRPVEIRRGALGRGLPRRDLRVSPEHAMLLEGMLVRAAALVNGRTIFHASVDGDVTYFHVELENEHGILLAEGAPSESFRDEGSRALFDNAAEYTLAHGTTAALPPLAAPRVDEGYQLEAIRHRLAGSADEEPAGSLRGHVERVVGGVLEGWIMDAANPLVPVEIEVRVGGEPVGRTIANAYRTDLHRAGIGVGRAGFRFVLPADCDDLATVSVVRAFDGARLPVAAPSKA